MQPVKRFEKPQKKRMRGIIELIWTLAALFAFLVIVLTSLLLRGDK